MDIFFDAFAASVRAENLGVYGIHVIQAGKPDHFLRFRADDRLNLYSGSKSVTSLAVGMAVEEKRVTLSDSLVDFFPEFRADFADGCERITVKDILQMRSGHMNHGFQSDEQLNEQAGDWAAVFFRQKMKETDREKSFYYENTCTYMLSRVMEKVTGESLRDYLMPRLFVPLAIPNPQWHTCPRGHVLGAIGLHLKTSEFARVGKLLLDDGVWNGKQLVSEEYICALQTEMVPSVCFDDEETHQGYGYQFWNNTIPNSFRMDGKYGQYCVILRDYDAVVAVTAHRERNGYDILRSVWKNILPRLR